METLSPAFDSQHRRLASMGPPPFGDGNRVARPGTRPRTPRFNGATAFQRWKHGNVIRDYLATIHTLQWGHRLSAMETTMLTVMNGSVRTLQWGHRLSAMETRLHPLVRRIVIVAASMGPPPFGDGNVRLVAGKRLRIHASMGPPPFGDGNDGPQNRRNSDRQASMGPPPFGDGNVWPVADALRRNGASMGPPPFGDGNFLRFLEVSSIDASLQWGHRLSAMETGRKGEDAGRRTTASMGPPPFGDGNPMMPRTRPTGMKPLQWGHRLSAMETGCAAVLVDTVPHLQPSMWPPPFSDGNSGECARWILSRMSSLQWGHRLSAMETLSLDSSECPSTPPFNGATAFQRWKPCL